MTKEEIEQASKEYAEGFRYKIEVSGWFKQKMEGFIAGANWALQSENERLKADNKPDHLKRSLELLDEFIRDNPNGLNEIIAKHIEKVGHDAYFLEDVERLKAEREWISVEDRLPENDDDILVCLIDEEIRVDWYDNKRQYWIRNNGDVTHWMPLPKPPKQ